MEATPSFNLKTCALPEFHSLPHSNNSETDYQILASIKYEETQTFLHQKA